MEATCPKSVFHCLPPVPLCYEGNLTHPLGFRAERHWMPLLVATHSPHKAQRVPLHSPHVRHKVSPETRKRGKRWRTGSYLSIVLHHRLRNIQLRGVLLQWQLPRHPSPDKSMSQGWSMVVPIVSGQGGHEGKKAICDTKDTMSLAQ